jgi:hypothetical protein
MKRIRYSKYVPDPAGEMSMEDLLSALSDYLLQSGFQNYMFSDMEGEQTLDDLRRAIEQALLDGNLLDEEMQERLRQMQMDDGQLVGWKCTAARKRAEFRLRSQKKVSSGSISMPAL